MDWNYYLQKGSPSFITTCFSFCFYCFCFLFDFFGPMWGVLLSFHFPSLLFVSPSNGAKGIAGGGGRGDVEAGGGWGRGGGSCMLYYYYYYWGEVQEGLEFEIVCLRCFEIYSYLSRIGT